jgi:hypothetical protein
VSRTGDNMITPRRIDGYMSTVRLSTASWWSPADGASWGRMRSYPALTPSLGRRTAVQQISTATCPPNTDLIRLEQTRELRQSPVLTSMQLVHTEEVTPRPPACFLSGRARLLA